MRLNDLFTKTLDQKRGIDSLYLTINSSSYPIYKVPSVIKASLIILNKLIDNGDKRNVMIFPEKSDTMIVFAIFKIIDDILEGRMSKSYDPKKFKKGQKLSFEGCVVEFDSYEKINGTDYIWVNTIDRKTRCRNGLPMSIAPFFQPIESQKPISKQKKYAETKKIIDFQRTMEGEGDILVNMLKDYKAHIVNSIGIVTAIEKVDKALSNRFIINGHKSTDVLLVGSSDSEGNISLLGTGQYHSKPTMLISPDLYSIDGALKKDNVIDLLVIDIKSGPQIEKQLDALDDILGKEIPVLAICDIINSFDITYLKERGFNVWRWDANNMSESLVSGSRVIGNKKYLNCLYHKIEYIEIEKCDIDRCIELLRKNQLEFEESSLNILSVYKDLLRLALKFLRLVAPLSAREKDFVKEKLDKAKKIIISENRYVSDELNGVLSSVVEIISNLCENNRSLKKISQLERVLSEGQDFNICIVIDKAHDILEVSAYYENYCMSAGVSKKISVKTYSEITSESAPFFDTIIVSGWFSEKKMKKILFGFSSPTYYVLLYGSEKIWKMAHMRKWQNVYQSEINQTYLKSLSFVDENNDQNIEILTN
ncbi:MAG TPA: hypothetical protein DCG34_13285 [Clostridiales bacterium]|jgi:hypothetical protein|nr:hypothetical protein [Clostridiales bacterium]